LKGDPNGWSSTYEIVISALFNPWLNIFAKVDFMFKYISPHRRRVMKATTRFNGMLQSLTEQRRKEILEGDTVGVPEGEKDLLTLMIEADIRENTETSTKEMRVSD
jgi:cytochrome P450